MIINANCEIQIHRSRLEGSCHSQYSCSNFAFKRIPWNSFKNIQPEIWDFVNQRRKRFLTYFKYFQFFELTTSCVVRPASNNRLVLKRINSLSDEITKFLKIYISEIEIVMFCLKKSLQVCECLCRFCDAWSIFDYVRISRIFTRALLKPFIKSFNLLTSAEASWLFQTLY